MCQLNVWPHQTTATNSEQGKESSIVFQAPFYKVLLNPPCMYACFCKPLGFQVNTSLLLIICEHNDIKWKKDQNDDASHLHTAKIQKLLVPPIVENTELKG